MMKSLGMKTHLSCGVISKAWTKILPLIEIGFSLIRTEVCFPGSLCSAVCAMAASAAAGKAAEGVDGGGV